MFCFNWCNLYGCQRSMVWCRAGVRGENLSSYNKLFYEPQTFANLGNPHALYHVCAPFLIFFMSQLGLKSILSAFLYHCLLSLAYIGRKYFYCRVGLDLMLILFPMLIILKILIALARFLL